MVTVRLAGIDVSRCASLEQLALPQFSGISELNLKGNPKLRNLSLECHSIQSLDLSGNPGMEYLYLALCRNIKVLDLNGCPELRVLDIVGTYDLEELRLHENTTLNKVKLSSDSRRKFNPGDICRMRVKDIDISGCQTLKYFNASFGVDYFDLRINPGITKVDITGDSCGIVDTLSVERIYL